MRLTGSNFSTPTRFPNSARPSQNREHGASSRSQHRRRAEYRQVIDLLTTASNVGGWHDQPKFFQPNATVPDGYRKMIVRADLAIVWDVLSRCGNDVV